MLFLWPFLLLGLLVLLGLWSIKDIKKNQGQHSWYKIRGTYGLLFIAILLLSRFTQKADSNNTGISNQASSIMVSSQSEKSDDQPSSEAAVSSQNAASESAARASAAKEAEAKSIAQQTIEQPTPQNDTGRTVFVTGGGKSDVYWYSTSSMPARTNKNNIITMTEADALAQGKRHSMTE